MWLKRLFVGEDNYQYVHNDDGEIDLISIKIKAQNSNISTIEVKMFWNKITDVLYVLMPSTDLNSQNGIHCSFNKKMASSSEYWIDFLDEYTDDRTESEYILENISNVLREICVVDEIR